MALACDGTISDTDDFIDDETIRKFSLFLSTAWPSSSCWGSHETSGTGHVSKRFLAVRSSISSALWPL